MTSTPCREAPLCAANIAALMFVVASCSALLLILLWGSTMGSGDVPKNDLGAALGAMQVSSVSLGSWHSPKKNLLVAFVAAIIAASLFARQRWAWWVASVTSTLYNLLVARELLSFSLVSADQFLGDQSGVISIRFIVLGASFVLAMLIAFIALLSKSARRSFGIGKAT